MTSWRSKLEVEERRKEKMSTTVLHVLRLKEKKQYRGGGKPPATILLSMFRGYGYFNYWIFRYNFPCNQFTGYLNVGNTFTIKGWNYKEIRGKG
jgi:hypothetical protein